MTNKNGEISSEDIRKYLDICLCANIREASRVITRLYDDMLNGTGIRSTQLTILMTIKNLVKTTVSNLAGELSMDASTVARNLQLLVKKDFVKITVGTDRRKKIVSLTDVGDKMVIEGLEKWYPAQKYFEDYFSNTELKDNIESINELTNIALKHKNFGRIR